MKLHKLSLEEGCLLASLRANCEVAGDWRLALLQLGAVLGRVVAGGLPRSSMLLGVVAGSLQPWIERFLPKQPTGRVRRVAFAD